MIVVKNMNRIVEQNNGLRPHFSLADNPFYSEFIDTLPLTAEAQSLPDMNGSGLVRDLRQATSLSGELAGQGRK